MRLPAADFLPAPALRMRRAAGKDAAKDVSEDASYREYSCIKRASSVATSALVAVCRGANVPSPMP